MVDRLMEMSGVPAAGPPPSRAAVLETINAILLPQGCTDAALIADTVRRVEFLGDGAIAMYRKLQAAVAAPTHDNAQPRRNDLQRRRSRSGPRRSRERHRDEREREREVRRGRSRSRERRRSRSRSRDRHRSLADRHSRERERGRSRSRDRSSRNSRSRRGHSRERRGLSRSPPRKMEEARLAAATMAEGAPDGLAMSTPRAPTGTPYRIEDDWPLEVRVFYPILGKTNATIQDASSKMDTLACELFAPGAKPAAAMTTHEFGRTPLRIGLFEVGDEHIRNWLEGVFESLADVSRAIQAARAASKRMFDIYTLATQTAGASWLTVDQLLYREDFDQQQATYDLTHRPLVDWADKVAAAMSACQQNSPLDKKGLPVGPVAPSVSRTLGRRGHRGAPRGPRSDALSGKPRRVGAPTAGRQPGPPRGPPVRRPPGGSSGGFHRHPKTAKALPGRRQDAGAGKPGAGDGG